ncbi:acyl-CoA dehydrogenase [Nocardia mangyaensis]|uniref:Acyl-CoA dehydrogenase n=1 Tax=Nocardia mangyaensis TaxID=2213200 RepID=A0A1J0VLU5_9NOCA|nr:acyl-CoA dehydrogenase family protein [Nocardia mangyaensis]APE32981.1 acyl-CoA dehydrogenase [Nocardia mangyaensis]
MRFALSTEQLDFAAELRKILDAGQVPAAVRAWADGDTGKGRALLRQVAEMGVFGLLVDEQYGGAEATPVDLTVALVELGRAAVPGPTIESAAVIPALLQGLPDPEPARRWLPALTGGGLLGTIAFDEPQRSIALDAETVDLVLVAGDGRISLGRRTPDSGEAVDPTNAAAADAASAPGQAAAGAAGDASGGSAAPASGSGSTGARASVPSPLASIDPARKLFGITADELVADGEDVQEAIDYAFDHGVLACAAQLLGAGRAILDQTTNYAKQRKQFGRAIGEFQAVKQQLADVLIALDLAEPLLYRAALTLDSPDRTRDVSAALVACGDAAHRAARAGLQVHGAIGYTAEYDLSVWLTRVTALRTAWGTADFHRARIATALRDRPAS